MNLYFYTVKTKRIWLLLTAGCVVLISVGIIACRHTPVFPDSPSVSFANDITPIIISNCTQSGCHGTAGQNESFSLLSYDDVMKHCKVVGGDPQKGKLYKTIKTLNPGSVMPRAPYPPLTDSQIELIYLWIGQGAKNN